MAGSLRTLEKLAEGDSAWILTVPLDSVVCAANGQAPKTSKAGAAALNRILQNDATEEI